MKKESSPEQGRPEGGSNRLIFEKSPYLLQHANNPVDWYPWGPEAFETARREDKPVFLSIGYSTCHWCHVMAHESFEDPNVARLMNEVFVSIKVDREERPDIDSVYMTVCQMMTGSGGWPLNIMMTPDKKPFLAGTYYPKESRSGRIGMLDLVPRVKEIWKNRRDEVFRSVEEIMAALQRATENPPGAELGESTLKLAYEQLAHRFDERHGGFGDAPKFPNPHNLLFLLRYRRRSGNEEALRMVEKTLQAMSLGGIYDHVGFGFHRYSTDPEWQVPHFEKMLYDQAMLALAYTEAHQATGNNQYGRTAQQILTYVLRDMTAPEGGFYSGEDADSEGEEGKYYVWEEKEIRAILSPEESEVVVPLFNVQPGGNFKEEATGRRTGKNILHMTRAPGEVASDLGIPEEDLQRIVEQARQKLFAARTQRVHPHKDDKILVDWNGLMIAALARGAQVFGEPAYAEAAKHGVDFILKNMVSAHGRLFHRFREGQSAVLANLDDYVFLIWGLLELYEATFDASHLEAALRLNDELLAHFWDDRAGGFYFTADDGEPLLVRKKEVYDGAIPSGNSVAALNLLRMGRITARPDFEARSLQIGHTFSGSVSQSPSVHTQLMLAVDFWLGPSYEVVIAGHSGAMDTHAMLKAVRRLYVPNKVVLLRPIEEETPPITRIAEYTKHQLSINNKATAYVCLNYHCKVPTADIGKMLELLGSPPQRGQPRMN